jgi:hypothetical protein
MATLKQAIAERRHGFDFLRGDELYKAHWRAQPRPTHDIRITSDTLAARLRNTVWLAGGSMKTWIKSNLGISGTRAQ